MAGSWCDSFALPIWISECCWTFKAIRSSGFCIIITACWAGRRCTCVRTAAYLLPCSKRSFFIQRSSDGDALYCNISFGINLIKTLRNRPFDSAVFFIPPRLASSKNRCGKAQKNTNWQNNINQTINRQNAKHPFCTLPQELILSKRSSHILRESLI